MTSTRALADKLLLVLAVAAVLLLCLFPELPGLFHGRNQARTHAGEFLIPKSEGLIGDEHIVGEIGEVLLGKAPARTSPDEITLFKSLGIAVEDLAAAHYVYRAAQERGLGAWLEIGGRHFGSAAGEQ